MECKVRTLERRISESSINMRTYYSMISDEELDVRITAARMQFPKFGKQSHN